MRGNLIVVTEPLAANIRCVLPSWIVAATAAADAGAGAGARCASWRLASGLDVMFLFLDDCGFSEHFSEEWKKKSTFSSTTPLSAKPTISEEV